MEYLPIQDFADKWNISKRRIQVLCKEGRVSGAKMIGNMWVIPENAARPADARTKNPTVAEAVTGGSAVRKDLKKLLKSLYKTAEILSEKENNKKVYVLSAIASGLCGYYIGKDLLVADIRKKVSKDLTGNDIDMSSEYMLEEVFNFIEKYKTDSELDNLLSWAYQYSNKIVKGNIYSQTQFFTEKYMINYLVSNIKEIKEADKVVDPCIGGGNFLVECLELMSTSDDATGEEFANHIIANARKLYGYDIDGNITRIALVNIKLRVLAILKRRNEKVSFDIWRRVCPNIYRSESIDKVCGSLDLEDKMVVNIINGDRELIINALGNADVVLTNPPFATVKGMCSEQKEFLKENYPDANCDMCVSYFEAIYKMLKPSGICGIVSQNAWMHLKTFRKIRLRITSQYKIVNIANLGSGAFLDLSGEKSNVALLIIKKEFSVDNEINVMDLNGFSLSDKKQALLSAEGIIKVAQNNINGVNGYDFSERGILKKISCAEHVYKDIAVPMQGTSTGNAKELVGYFWEHFGDGEWISVSNGGGYCRWQGLNDSVVKWGVNGEYVKAQKGSALRNIKYFPETQMVFSDTGTAGLNVRVLLNNQIFIASGPGIRITKGNEYAHLALLNSRFAAYCVRMMSPKLTIAAGYIGQIPITGNIGSSVVLEKNARLCIELKQKILSTRPNNVEYNSMFLREMPDDLEVAAWGLLNEDITNELLKLQIESKIDSYIFEEFDFSEEDMEQVEKTIGECAYFINGSEEIDLVKLDRYMEKLLDASCCLKRTRVLQNSLGCDGIIEYISKDLKVNPEIIVKRIQEKPYVMKAVLEKYKKMILHATILECLGYSTRDGVKKDACLLGEISEFLSNKFKDNLEFKAWIKEYFNPIHTEIFKRTPYLIYENGAIRKYDNKIAGQNCKIY